MSKCIIIVHHPAYTASSKSTSLHKENNKSHEGTMEFPTLAAYPAGLSYEETSQLLSEMQHPSSEMASRDEAEVSEREEEGYEINFTDGTVEISATEMCERSHGEKWKKPASNNSTRKSKPNKSSRSSYRGMEAPLSPHVDATAMTMADPPVGKDPADEGSSIMDTLSDLAEGVDQEMDTGAFVSLFTICLLQNQVTSVTNHTLTIEYLQSRDYSTKSNANEIPTNVPITLFNNLSRRPSPLNPIWKPSIVKPSMSFYALPMMKRDVWKLNCERVTRVNAN